MRIRWRRRTRGGRFRLRRTTATSHVWETLLGRPTLRARHVRVGLGSEEGHEFAASRPRPELELVRPGCFYLTLLCWGIAIVLFVWLAATSGVIRDSVPVGVPERERPCRLDRWQTALRLFLVTAGLAARAGGSMFTTEG